MYINNNNWLFEKEMQFVLFFFHFVVLQFICLLRLLSVSVVVIVLIVWQMLRVWSLILNNMGGPFNQIHRMRARLVQQHRVWSALSMFFFSSLFGLYCLTYFILKHCCLPQCCYSFHMICFALFLLFLFLVFVLD